VFFLVFFFFTPSRARSMISGGKMFDIAIQGGESEKKTLIAARKTYKATCDKTLIASGFGGDVSGKAQWWINRSREKKKRMEQSRSGARVENSKGKAFHRPVEGNG